MKPGPWLCLAKNMVRKSGSLPWEQAMVCSSKAARPIDYSPFSVELCGGTHVTRTGDIGLVKIISESAVGAGVRRIEALSGDGARLYLGEQDERVKEIADLLKTTGEAIPERLRSLLDERKSLEKALAEAKRKLAMGESQRIKG